MVMSCTLSNPDAISPIISTRILNQGNGIMLLKSAERDTRLGTYKGKKC
jgi:hypothetical protein